MVILTKQTIQTKFPDVFESYTMQLSLAESKYDEKKRFWETNGINCFERWTVPYFLEREKEKKRPCLRLNYPPDGRCNDCVKNCCRYDKICFMCGLEGHGAFQSFPGGKMKGELKCIKHRNFLAQLAAIRAQYGLDEEDIRKVFKTGTSAGIVVATSSAVSAPIVTTVASNASTVGKADVAAASVATGADPSVEILSMDAQAQPKKIAGKAAANGINGIAEVKTNSKVKDKSPGAVIHSAKPSKQQKAADTSAVVAAADLSAGYADGAVDVVANGVLPTHYVPLTNSVGLSGIGGRQEGSNSGNFPSPVEGGGMGIVGQGLLNLQSAVATPFGVSRSSLSGLSLAAEPISLGESHGGHFHLSLSQQSFGTPLISQVSPISLPNGNNSQGALWTQSQGQISNGHSNNNMSAVPFTSLSHLDYKSIISQKQQASGVMNIMNGSLLDSQLHINSPTNTAGLRQFPSPAPFDSSSVSVGGGVSGSAGITIVDVGDLDEFSASPCTLRLSLSLPQVTKDAAYALSPNAGAGVAVSGSLGPLIYKASLLSTRGSEDVAVVACALKNTPGPADLVALRKELKVLRFLSKTSPYLARYIGPGLIDVFIDGIDYQCIVSEYSEFGYLDRFLYSYLQLCQSDASASAISGVTSQDAMAAIPNSDLQAMAVQLIDAVSFCHARGMCHRDIRPSNILVTRANKFQAPVFGCAVSPLGCGFVLKLTDFRLGALAQSYGHGVGSAGDSDADRFVAPELDSVSKNTGIGFQPYSDLWSLGLVLYFVGTAGHCPFDSRRQARSLILGDAAVAQSSAAAEELRRLLEMHGLHQRLPMLHDLVERLVRAPGKRASLSLLRCHPFLWNAASRRKFLVDFANASTSKGSDAIDSFMTDLDRYSPHFVFGTNGWISQMSPALLAHVQPPSLKADYWWSGKHLLQAIRNQLAYPELLNGSVFPRSSMAQLTAAYLRQVVEIDFPRLLILLFELGMTQGKWEWDGDEIIHSWNQ